jgi:hypothetical protein
LCYADEDLDQETVAGVEGVGEQGVDVAGERAQETEDQDGSRERYGYEVGEHPDEGDLVKGGRDYGRGPISAARETEMRFESCPGGSAKCLSRVRSTRDFRGFVRRSVPKTAAMESWKPVL